jgi:hypothetical protein
MFCPNCGQENPEGSEYCMRCGTSLSFVDVGEPVGEAPVMAYTAPPPPRKKSRLGLFLFGALVLVLVAAVAVAAVLFWDEILGFIRPTSEHVLLASLDRSGEADLYLVKLGQEEDEGTVLAEEALPGREVYFRYMENGEWISSFGGEFGGFVPASNHVVFWFSDGDEVVMRGIDVGDDESHEIIEPEGFLAGYIFAGSDTAILQEVRSGQSRCYAARFGEEADRVARGDTCGIALDGSMLYFTEVDDGKTTLSTVGLDGKNEAVVLDDVENLVSTRVSEDLSHVAYLHNTEGGQQLYLVDRGTGETSEASPEMFSMPHYYFLPKSDTLYYIAENEEGLLELHTSDNPNPIAEGISVGAGASADGQALVYVVEDEDGVRTVYAHPMGGGEDVEVLSATDLEYYVLPSSNKVIIHTTDEDETRLYSANVDGSNLVEVFDGQDITIGSIHYVRAEPYLYILVREEDGTLSLFFASTERDEGLYLVEEWADVRLLNRSEDASHLVFSGREDAGDDLVLYSVATEAGARPVELDDDNEGFWNAVFAADGKEVVYTARTGDNEDDWDVCQVIADGSEGHEVLYREARLADVRWDQLGPFNMIWWNSLESGSSFCPGARSVQVGETVDGQMDEGEEACYRLRAQEGAVITFDVTTPEVEDFDLELTFYDRDGNQIGYNDDGPRGWDPRLTTSIPQTGIYFVVLRELDEAEATFSLTVREGPGETAFAGAQRLQPGERLRDAVTGESSLHLESYDWNGYGVTYYVEGEAGDAITIDVFADSIGSDLDPVVYLFDSSAEIVADDDDGGEGYDSQLVYTLDSTGRYYVMVISAGEDYGDASTFFYEIELSIP